MVCADGNTLCATLSEISAVKNSYAEELTGETTSLHSYVDTWYVPRNFYRLIKVEMWKNEISTSGFRLTYERPDIEFCNDWPVQLTHTFGTQDDDKDYETIDLTSDLDSVILCIDD